MKHVILILVAAFIFLSCRTSEPKKDIDYKELSQDLVAYSGETFAHIAISENLDALVVKEVVRAYNEKKYQSLGGDMRFMTEPDYVINVIDSIASANGLSREKTFGVITRYGNNGKLKL
ncbi:MAG: hypothetical protein ACK5LR_02425 [Mangrovibacterium sp.]